MIFKVNFIFKQWRLDISAIYLWTNRALVMTYLKQNVLLFLESLLDFKRWMLSLSSIVS